MMGGLRIAARLAMLIALLVAGLAVHWLHQFVSRFHSLGPSPWPRRYLAATAWIAGLRITLCGRPAQGSTVLLANHVSWLDIPALAGITGARFAGHAELVHVPLVSWLCALNETVFIARNNRASVATQIADLHAALTHPRPLALFPEGTTSCGTTVPPFKSALLAAFAPPPPGVAVQPVLLDYGPHSADIAWVDQHGLANFLQILSRGRPIALTIRFLPPLRDAALAGRKAMAAAAQQALAAGLAR